jgi:hypothetical protein
MGPTRSKYCPMHVARGSALLGLIIIPRNFRCISYRLPPRFDCVCRFLFRSSRFPLVLIAHFARNHVRHGIFMTWSGGLRDLIYRKMWVQDSIRLVLSIWWPSLTCCIPDRYPNSVGCLLYSSVETLSTSVSLTSRFFQLKHISSISDCCFWLNKSCTVDLCDPLHGSVILIFVILCMMVRRTIS